MTQDKSNGPKSTDVAHHAPGGIGEIKSVEKTLTVTETIEIDDASHRRTISKYIINAFIIINVAILLIIIGMFITESYIIESGDKGYTRIVDSKTILALIGATTVQFGAIALAVSNWLFPKRK